MQIRQYFTMQRIFPRFIGGPGAVSLLLLRVLLGTGLILHGLEKTSNPMHWMDGMMNALPPILQLAAVIFECAGGVAVILGLLTPAVTIVGLGQFFLAYLTQFTGEVWIENQSFQLTTLYFTGLLNLLFIGPGTLSVDYILFNFFNKEDAAQVNATEETDVITS